MYRATHVSGVIDQMAVERLAQADANRLAALSRAGRTRRPSLVGRIGGRLATVTASVRRHAATHDVARVTRP